MNVKYILDFKDLVLKNVKYNINIYCIIIYWNNISDMLGSGRYGSRTDNTCFFFLVWLRQFKIIYVAHSIFLLDNASLSQSWWSHSLTKWSRKVYAYNATITNENGVSEGISSLQMKYKTGRDIPFSAMDVITVCCLEQWQPFWDLKDSWLNKSK